MAIIKTTTPEQWRALAAALELISANAAILAQSARENRFEQGQLDKGLAGICDLANGCRAVARLPRKWTPS